MAAQDSTPPDLGTGWELQLSQPMDEWSAVAGADGLGFVVRGPDGVALWSPDGFEWQEITDPLGRGPMFELAANATGFVAADGSRLPSSSVLFSPDGLTWEQHQVGVSADFFRVEAGPDGFFLVSGGCNLVVRFSADGRNWEPVTLPRGCRDFLAAPIDGDWAGLGQRGDDVLGLTSSDGTHWTEIEAQPPLPRLTSPGNWPGYADALRRSSLSSDGHTLVVAGRGPLHRDEGPSSLWVSTDAGASWTEQTGVDGNVNMAVSDFGFVGVGPERVIVSGDGASWVEHRVDGVQFHDVASIGNTVVATADDGIYTWTPTAPVLAFTGAEPALLLTASGVLIAAGILTLAVRRRLIPEQR